MSRRWKNFCLSLVFVLVGSVFTSVVSACDFWGSPERYYAPYSYGYRNRCYYAFHEEEVFFLKRDGLCLRHWTAAPMPVDWHAQYALYYNDPVYYDYYVPKHVRSTYVNVTIVKFEENHADKIERYQKSSNVKWRGSDNQPYYSNTVYDDVSSKHSGFYSAKHKAKVRHVIKKKTVEVKKTIRKVKKQPQSSGASTQAPVKQSTRPPVKQPTRSTTNSSTYKPPVKSGSTNTGSTTKKTGSGSTTKSGSTTRSK